MCQDGVHPEKELSGGTLVQVARWDRKAILCSALPYRTMFPASIHIPLPPLKLHLHPGKDLASSSRSSGVTLHLSSLIEDKRAARGESALRRATDGPESCISAADRVRYPWPPLSLDG